jgi:hypothetical protein
MLTTPFSHDVQAESEKVLRCHCQLGSRPHGQNQHPHYLILTSVVASEVPPLPFRKRSVPAPLYALRWARADDLLRPERRLSLDGRVSGLPAAA